MRFAIGFALDTRLIYSLPHSLNAKNYKAFFEAAGGGVFMFQTVNQTRV